MNIAEGHRLKQLEATVESQGKRIQDQDRRIDDISKVLRMLEDSNALASKPKKAANG
jgi:cell division protein FtsL